MLLLALDTATAGVVVGVLRRTRPQEAVMLAEERGSGATRHGEAMPVALAAALAAAGVGLPDIEAIVVGVGPGPFTGLRIGIVTAAALGDALGVPVHPVCSLDAIGVTLPGSAVVVTDARRREVYWAAYEQGTRTEGPHVQRPADLLRSLAGRPVATMVGPGAVLYAEALAPWTPVEGLPTARGLVAAAGAALTAAPAPLVPRYLRRPDATPPPARVPATPTATDGRRDPKPPRGQVDPVPR